MTDGPGSEGEGNTPEEANSTIGRRRALLVAAAGLVPWVLIPYDAGASVVFSFGLLNPNPLSLETVFRYVFVDTGPLPRSLRAWPIATLLYGLAVASTLLSFFGLEDRRLTTTLLALAGANVLYFAVTFSSTRLRVLALPVGVAVLWLAAWASRPEPWRRL